MMQVPSAFAQEIPWHLGSLSSHATAPAAINSATVQPGEHQVVVAIIDSGLLASHPAVAPSVLTGYDMISSQKNLRGKRSTDFSPDERNARCSQRLISDSYRTHGTEVASLVAGNGFDGVRGVNPSARILPIRLFGACGLSRSDLLDAIAWAAGFHIDGVPDNSFPARVLNMSLTGGSEVCGKDLQLLIDRVIEKGSFVVAAAGNNFHRPMQEPANCKGVISVGALDAENQIEVYSALDPRTVIYAPGGGKKIPIDAPWAGNKLKVATFEVDFFGNEKPAALYHGIGTSYAAPLVSGFVSLWLSRHPEKKMADFLNDLPNFVRPVKPNTSCSDCAPRGLAVNINNMP